MARSEKTAVVAAPEMMTIAFPYGGILPTDVTGGAEQSVAAHEAVSVPKPYGEHLVADRFAYVPVSDVPDDDAELAKLELEDKLTDLRAQATKETDTVKKSALEVEIADIETKLAALPN